MLDAAAGLVGVLRSTAVSKSVNEPRLRLICPSEINLQGRHYPRAASFWQRAGVRKTASRLN